jgi:hypothetical protein
MRFRREWSIRRRTSRDKSITCREVVRPETSSVRPKDDLLRRDDDQLTYGDGPVVYEPPLKRSSADALCVHSWPTARGEQSGNKQPQQGTEDIGVMHSAPHLNRSGVSTPRLKWL